MRVLRPGGLPGVWRTVKVAGYLAALALLAAVAWRGRHEVDPSRIAAGQLALAFVAALVSWVALAAGWAFVSHAEDPLSAVRTWVRTQLLRYLPGGVWAPAARARDSARLRRGLTFVIAEDILLVLTATAGGASVLAASSDPRWGWLAAPMLPLFAAVIWLCPRFSLARRSIAAAIGCYCAGFAAFAAAALCAQRAVGAVPHPWLVVGAALLAWVVGLVVVTAPGGIGAREAAYIALLAGVIPQGQLAAGAVAARVTAVFAEALVLATLALPPLVARWAARLQPGFVQALPQVHSRPEAELVGVGDVDPDGGHLSGLRREMGEG